MSVEAVTPCIIVPRWKVAAEGDAYLERVVSRMCAFMDDLGQGGSVVSWTLDDDGGEYLTVVLEVLERDGEGESSGG